jgi:hypothetical protein
MGEGVTAAWTRSRVLFAFSGLIATLALSALAAPSASAQGPGSEFCDEYPSAPGCETGPTGDTGDAGETGDAGTSGMPDAGPTAGIGAPGGSELPFTGYPLTALILLLLILLLLGLAIRAYLAVRDRIVSDRAAGP